MNLASLRELTLTRLRLFFREPGAVFWTFGFPLLLSVALGLAFRNRPPEPARAGVVLGTLPQSPGLVVTPFSEERAAREALRTARIDVVVKPGPVVEYVYDPARPESRLARALVDLALHPATNPPTRDVPVTEPGARYIDFLIPGLLGMNIMSSGMWGIAWVVVEMRTRKLLKRLVATPMSRAQFLWSFVIMRGLFLFLELPVLLGFGWLAFNVRVAGSLPLLFGVSVLGALAFSGLGLLVAARAQNSQTASGLINLVMLPMFVGSGVFFSTARFPAGLQPFLRALPLTALNEALRAVINEGAGPAGVLRQCALLFGLAVVTFAAALRLFRWR